MEQLHEAVQAVDEGRGLAVAGLSQVLAFGAFLPGHQFEFVALALALVGIFEILQLVVGRAAAFRFSALVDDVPDHAEFADASAAGLGIHDAGTGRCGVEAEVGAMQQIVLGDGVEFQALATALRLLADFLETGQLAEGELQHQTPHFLEEIRHGEHATGGFLDERMGAVGFQGRAERGPQEVGTTDVEIEVVLQDVPVSQGFPGVEQGVAHGFEHVFLPTGLRGLRPLAADDPDGG